MPTYDVVVIGAGHNGLIAGCYLAKARLRVHVLERREIVGGDTTTEEVGLPGFKHNVGAHFLAQLASTPIPDELELLTKYGLKFLAPEGVVFLGLFPDGSCFVQYESLEKTVEEVERKFSKRDAKAYVEYYKTGRKVFEMRVGQLAPPISPEEFARSITGPEAEDFWWIMRTNIENVLNEYFEDERLKAYLAWAGCAKGINPYQYGNAPYAFIPAIMHDTGFALGAGGSQALPDALVRCLVDHGGSVQTNAEVTKILVKDGTAWGVKLQDGTTVEARRAVLSNINVKLMLERNILEAEHLSPDLVRKIRRLRAGYIQDIGIYCAVNEAPRYTAYPGLPPYTHIQGTSIDKLGDFFHGIRMGRPVTEGIPLLVDSESCIDPGLAPPGKHTLWCSTFAPYNLKNGRNWDEYKEEYADVMMEILRQYAPNMTKGNLLDRNVESPLDMERRNPNNYKGCWGMLELAPDQSEFLRPTMELSHYRTPINGLYLTGGGTFPSGGVTGAPGHNAAHVILEDLGISE